MIAEMMKKAMLQQGTPAGPAAAAGRNGDEILAHITPEEAALLKRRGGSGTINPETGVMEFYEEGESRSDAMGAMDRGGGYASSWGDIANATLGLSNSIGRGDFDFNGGGYGGGGNNDQGYDQGYSQSVFGGAPGYDTGNWQSIADSTKALSDSIGAGNFDFSGNGGEPSNQYSAAYDPAAPAFDYDGLISDTNALNAEIGDPSYGDSFNIDGASGLGDDVGAGTPSPGAPTGAGGAAPANLGAGGFFNPAAGGAFSTMEEDPANPLSSFGIGTGGQLLSSTVVDGNVYSQDPNAIDAFSNAGLAGMRGVNFDNTDRLGTEFAGARGFAGDPTAEDAEGGRAAGGQRDSNIKDSAGVVGSSFQGDSFSPAGGAGFGLNARGGYVEGAPATEKGSLFNEGFGRQVPGQIAAQRDPSTFSTPIADAMARTYAANPNMPNTYLEGAYGIETNYGKTPDRPGSAFSGPMQFSKSSIADVNPPGARNPQNPYDAMLAMSNEYNRMVGQMGRNVTAPEAYQMHQQGITGGSKMLNNPSVPAADLVRPGNLTANNLPTDILGNGFSITPRVSGSAPYGSFFGSFSDYDPNRSLTMEDGPQAPSRIFQGS